MKKVLGLDLGTNSIGWALIRHDQDENQGEIIKMGSRIIPMSQDVINDFGRGNKVSKTAERTTFRQIRRLNERRKLRRERLVKVLKRMAWVPDQFDPLSEKLAYPDGNFAFMESYQEMLSEFRKQHGEEFKAPHDWTIYYLRKKALKEKILPAELAWVILQFNTKRGYYELRSEEEEAKGSAQNKEFMAEKVIEVLDTGEKRKGSTVWEIHLENGLKGELVNKMKPGWEGMSKEFIVTIRTLKDGSQTCTLSVPDENDWTLRKKKTEQIIDRKQLNVGEYIYDRLLANPRVKIRGKKVHTIERKFYREELKQILKVQSRFHPELQDTKLLSECIHLLYKNNEGHRNALLSKDFLWLLVNDIIFYQRPLRSKKSLIAGCKYETRTYIKEGELQQTEVKCASRTNPWFQEYRIWSFIHNFRLIKMEETDEKGLVQQDVDKTANYLTEEAKEKLFNLLSEVKEASPARLLKTIGCPVKEYRLNYADDVKIKGNESRAAFLKAFKKAECEEEGRAFLQDREKEYRLWHILYSLNEHDEVRSALSNEKLGFPVKAVEAFVALARFKKDYGALSEKALRKLVPLMRCGKYWKEEDISPFVLERIQKLIDGEADESIDLKVRERLAAKENLEQFRALPEYMAAYVVYGRHSESKDKTIYEKPEDIRRLKQHSLRNPIVEQVINETLMLVKDLWAAYGRPDEIHVEMGRELKNPAGKRKEMAGRRAENERANTRARAMLRELKKDISSINPHSVGQTDMFRIYEEGALRNAGELETEITGILRSSDPKPSELMRYKLWLDQKYISPYTGSPIALSDVFSSRCEIEHIIPRSRYYDDSFNNKIICESEVNKEKGNMTAYEFICEKGGMIIKLSSGRSVTILQKENYEHLMKKLYRYGSPKYKNLMSYDIPESFIQRQLNDTRYISKAVRELLAPVVRQPEEEAEIPKGIITLPGRITSMLKKEWGLEQVWKEIVAPRFIRLNEITGTEDYYERSADGRSFILKNHNGLKRIDHRHHALDALVVACTTRSHIIYLSTLNNEKNAHKYAPKLLEEGKGRRFRKPWGGFTEESLDAIKTTMVTFKSNHRVLTRGKNYYYKWVNENGVLKKKHVRQTKDQDLWAIRQSLHKDTVNAKISLRQYKQVSLATALQEPETIASPEFRKHIKSLFRQYNGDLNKVKKHLKEQPLLENGKPLSRITVYGMEDFSASRKAIDPSLTKKNLDKVVDPKIRQLLSEHLERYDDDSEAAFSAEGLEKLNRELDMPVYKVKYYESMGKKFPLGSTGNKGQKYVEAAKNTNLFFVIYENAEGERIINADSSLLLKEVIERKKQGLPLADHKEGYRWFTLSPGDIVYIPEPEENIAVIDWDNLSSEQMDKLYKCVSFSSYICYFVPNSLSEILADKLEMGSQNKSEKDINGQVIKNHCIKLFIDRIGSITPSVLNE